MISVILHQNPWCTLQKYEKILALLKEMAPAVLAHPEARPQGGSFLWQHQVYRKSALDLTLVDGQTRVSDVNADEGSPHDAGSNTTLPARVQTRSRSPCPLLSEQERCPDSQGAWRLGQLSKELDHTV